MRGMIDLPDVTLCCVDTKHHRLAARSLLRSTRDVRFGHVLFLTDALPPDISLPSAIEVRRIDKLESRGSYSAFMLKELADHVETTYALVTQWDGYVVHADTWDPAFLSCDYLGAKWPECPEPFNVGNGGFSLRSRRLLTALRDDRIEPSLNEDQVICGTARSILQGDYGIHFGSAEMADRFSFELDQSIPRSGQRTFGFHGLFNFFFVEHQSELVRLAADFTDDIVRSEFFLLLLRNCFNFKQWDAAVALGRRVIVVNSGHREAADIVAEAEAMQRNRSTQEPSIISKIAMRLLQGMRPK